MAYLLRSRGLTLRLRDGQGPEAPVYVVGADKWVLFDTLPSNTRATGDGDVEVREVVSAEGHERGALAVKKAVAPVKAPEAQAEGEKQAKRKSKLR